MLSTTTVTLAALSANPRRLRGAFDVYIQLATHEHAIVAKQLEVKAQMSHDIKGRISSEFNDVYPAGCRVPLQCMQYLPGARAGYARASSGGPVVGVVSDFAGTFALACWLAVAVAST